MTPTFFKLNEIQNFSWIFPQHPEGFKRPTATRSCRSFSRLAGFSGTRGSRGGPAGSPIICMASLTGTGLVSMNKVLTRERVW